MFNNRPWLNHPKKTLIKLASIIPGKGWPEDTNEILEMSMNDMLNAG